MSQSLFKTKDHMPQAVRPHGWRETPTSNWTHRGGWKDRGCCLSLLTYGDRAEAKSDQGRDWEMGMREAEVVEAGGSWIAEHMKCLPEVKRKVAKSRAPRSREKSSRWHIFFNRKSISVWEVLPTLLSTGRMVQRSLEDGVRWGLCWSKFEWF